MKPQPDTPLVVHVPAILDLPACILGRHYQPRPSPPPRLSFRSAVQACVNLSVLLWTPSGCRLALASFIHPQRGPSPPPHPRPHPEVIKQQGHFLHFEVFIHSRISPLVVT